MADSTLVLPQNTTDFSYFAAPTGATPITVAAASLTSNTRNFLELQLTTVDGTPLSKVFWDSTVNSGAGSEFSQVVNTVTDLAVTVSVLTTAFSGSVDALPLAILDVDNGGLITSIFDRRDLFGRLAKPGNLTNEFSWGTKVDPVFSLTLTGVTGTFVSGETLTIGGETATVVTGGTTSITFNKVSGVNFFPATSSATGGTSAATGTVATFTEAFVGVDKNIHTVEDAVKALMTEMKKIKGTNQWYDDTVFGLTTLRDGTASYVVGGGTANAPTATFSPPFTALVDGMGISFRPLFTNSTLVDFTLDALPLTGVKKHSGGLLVFLDPGDISQNITAHLVYSLSAAFWILLNPATSVTTTAANVFTADQKVSKAAASFIANATSSSPNYIFERAGAISGIIASDTIEGIGYKDSGSVNRVTWDLTNGKQTLGIVPLERLALAAGGAVFDASNNMIAGNIPDARLTANVALENVTNKFTALQLTDAVNYVVGAGTANAHTATFNPPFTALVDGMEVTILPFASSTLPAPTFKLDALPAQVIVKNGGSGGGVGLGVDDIRAGVPATFIYDLTNTRWYLKNPATSVTTTAANVFTSDQTVQGANAQQTINATTGVPGVRLKLNSLESAQIVSNAVDQLNIRNSSSTTKVTWDASIGKQTLGTVPLARMMVGNVGARNSSSVIITSTQTPITSLNLSGLKVDDQVIISVDVLFNKTTTAGMINLELSQNGGTAALDFTPGGGTLIAAGQAANVPANTSARIHLTVNVLVTSTGDGLATIQAGASSAGSTSTVLGFNGSLYAMALLGS